MTNAILIYRSLRFHARSHLGALLGAAVGTAVLIGALLVGDSVRGSLRSMALSRLGASEFALVSNDRFIRAGLAEELARATGAQVAPALQVDGTAVASDGSARANHVQVLGIEARFWEFGTASGRLSTPGTDEVILNQPLAEQLRAKVGDQILLRVDKPSRFSREAPLSPQDDFALPLRVTVSAIASEGQMGRFSLQANQVAPFNAFVSLSWLNERLELPGRANLLLLGALRGDGISALQKALRETWQLADAELEMRELPDGTRELRTPRVFLDAAVVDAAMTNHPMASGALTYFVNELRSGAKAAPYSMVTATGPPVVPDGVGEKEILVNPWLATDLGLEPGDTLDLSYFVIGAARRLEERTNQFTVRSILPLEGMAGDPNWMPSFPGIEKAESTRDWDSSLPIQLEKIRPQDEEYWKKHRGTPKAFISLAAGQSLWTNRFGQLTAIRFPAGTPISTLSKEVLDALDPASVGLGFTPVRQQALAASAQAQDFGQLFLGFSFFLIAAALLLMALLFQFGIERRATEIGTLLAVGFPPGHVRRLLVFEGVGLALVGALVGVPGGILYARAMLYGLSTIWRDAVGTSALQYHGQPSTLITGIASGLVVASLTLWLALRKQARQPARVLLAQGAELERSGRRQQNSRGIWIGWLSSAAAMLILGAAGLQQRAANPGVFFLAGTLLLISGMGFAAAWLTALAGSESSCAPRLSDLGLRNAARRRRRSLTTMGLLACGSFLIAAIGVFRLEVSDAVGKRSSGTGGFALLGESSFPIVHDLNSEQGRQFFGLGDRDWAGVRVVPFRVRAGEDASCLNLNRAQRPTLLGVRPEHLNERRAFTFSQVADGHNERNPWLLLNGREPDGSVPAIADAASIQWALGKKVGDVLTYTDERGREFQIRLVAAVANSILQGNVIIAESEFLKRFPSESGYRLFLADVDPPQPERINDVAALLSRATQDYGLEVIPAARRLAMLNAVQNTYLNTFQVLGGLGLLLGSVGLGVVVLRNVLERRNELALLLAVGLRPRALRWLVVSEHGALLLAGLCIGILSAFVAVLPTVLAPGAELPWRSLGLTLGAVFTSGLLWTWAAAHLALRGKLLDALRNE